MSKLLLLIYFFACLALSDFTRSLLQIRLNYSDFLISYGTDGVQQKLHFYNALLDPSPNSSDGLVLQLYDAPSLLNTACSYLVVDSASNFGLSLAGNFSSIIVLPNGTCLNSSLCSLYPDIFTSSEGGSISQSILFSGCVGLSLGCSQHLDFLSSSSHQVVGFVLSGVTFAALLAVLCIQAWVNRRASSRKHRKPDAPKAVFSNIEQNVPVKFHI